MTIIIVTVCVLAAALGLAGILEWRERQRLERAKILSSLIETEHLMKCTRKRVERAAAYRVDE